MSEETLQPPSPLRPAVNRVVENSPVNDNIPRALFFGEIFKPEECERVLQSPVDLELTQQFAAHQRDLMPGYAQYMQAESRLLAMSPENHWLFDYLSKLLRVLNDKHYHFDLERLLGTQILTLKPGMKVDWHFDLGNGLFAKRKLSLVAFLTPHEQYEGGALDLMTNGTYAHRRQQGVIGVFPAYYVSAFQPVTSGEMQVLLTWMHGADRFR